MYTPGYLAYVHTGSEPVNTPGHRACVHTGYRACVHTGSQLVSDHTMPGLNAGYTEHTAAHLNLFQTIYFFQTLTNNIKSILFPELFLNSRILFRFILV